MSVHRPHFDAPPLVEAVFDCFVEPNTPMDVADLEERFFYRFPDYAERTRQPWHQFSSSVEIRDGRPSTHPVESQLSGVRRWNADQNRAVLVGPAVLALNIKPPYGHFEDHLPHLQELVAVFRDFVGPARILWLGHRYVNHVVLDLDEGQDPGDLLTLYPRLSKGRALSHPPVAVQVEAGRFEGGSVVTSLVLGAKTAQKVIYSLDIYARTNEQIEFDATRVTLWHSVAHGAIMDAFLETVTPQARARFKERTS